MDKIVHKNQELGDVVLTLDKETPVIDKNSGKEVPYLVKQKFSLLVSYLEEKGVFGDDDRWSRVRYGFGGFDHFHDWPGMTKEEAEALTKSYIIHKKGLASFVRVLEVNPTVYSKLEVYRELEDPLINKMAKLSAFGTKGLLYRILDEEGLLKFLDGDD